MSQEPALPLRWCGNRPDHGEHEWLTRDRERHSCSGVEPSYLGPEALEEFAHRLGTSLTDWQREFLGTWEERDRIIAAQVRAEVEMRLAYDPEFAAKAHMAAQLLDRRAKEATGSHLDDYDLSLARNAAALALVLGDSTFENGHLRLRRTQLPRTVTYRVPRV